MARLPEQFIHQVQQATDIVDLIGQHVSMRQRGRNYVGLCPFHQEKTPSFNVSPSKQIFKCFGCGAGGGVFQFVMLQSGCTFPEAVRLLADRAGIAMPAYDGDDSDQAGQDRQKLLRLMRFAAEFYQRQLGSPTGAQALAYARERQLSDESIERFELGYAPDSWDALRLAARKAGFSEKQLLAAGLVIARDGGGCYDRFRNRLVFPIIDTAGRVVAFGARALAAGEGAGAKYLNSPETILFDKSSNLYGLGWARQAISAADQVVIVEGYFDVLMPQQAGVGNVVATLGTAVTDRHVRTLSRLAGDMVLVFDSDAAGDKAAQRAVELFIAQRINVRIATIPEGKDPCDYVLAHGGEALRELIAAAPDALEYLWHRRSAEFADGATLVQKGRAVEEFLTIVARSAAYGAIDAVRQGLLVNRLAHLLGVSAEQLTGQLRRMARRSPPPKATEPQPVAAAVAATAGAQAAASPQQIILEVIVTKPDLFARAAEAVELEDLVARFGDSPLAAVTRELWRLGHNGRLTIEALLEAGQTAEWGRIVTDLMLTGQRRGNHTATLQGAVDRLAAERDRQAREQLRQAGDDDSLRALSEQLRRPDARRRPW